MLTVEQLNAWDDKAEEEHYYDSLVQAGALSAYELGTIEQVLADAFGRRKQLRPWAAGPRTRPDKEEEEDEASANRAPGTVRRRRGAGSPTRMMTASRQRKTRRRSSGKGGRPRKRAGDKRAA